MNRLRLARECIRAQGYKQSWNNYKLHIDTADCGAPTSALLSSPSMHDRPLQRSLVVDQRYTREQPL